MKISIFAKYLTLLSAAAVLVAQPPPASPARPDPTPSEKPVVPPPTVAPETVVLTIGTEQMTRAQFENLLAALASSGRAATTPEAKRQVAEQLGELKGVAQEARNRKLDQNPDIKQMIAIQTDNLLANALARQVSGDLKVDDAAMHTYYDAHKSQYEEAKASHILIRFQGSRVPLKTGQKDLTEAEALAKAQELRKKILAGANFADIAKAESDDAQSGAQGGSLGTFARGQMVPAFDQSAFSLPIGQLSEPVKSDFGYHLIKVDERKSKSFEQARADIEKQLRPQLTKDAMEKIKGQMPVTLNSAYFGK